MDEEVRLLDDPIDSRAVRARFAIPLQLDVALRLARAEQPPPKDPLRFCRSEGRRLGEIIWTTSGILVLVSETLAVRMANEGVTGWSTFPVKLEGFDSAVPYFGLMITGRCGIGDLLSPTTQDSRVFELDLDTWDGSDLFTTTNRSAWIFSTSRMCALIDEFHYPNGRCSTIDVVRSR